MGPLEDLLSADIIICTGIAHLISRQAGAIETWST
jgi:hypothetical protein